MKKYEPVVIRDYGSLTDLTAATSIAGSTEDGATKALPFHHTPPSQPSAP